MRGTDAKLILLGLFAQGIFDAFHCTSFSHVMSHFSLAFTNDAFNDAFSFKAFVASYLPATSFGLLAAWSSLSSNISVPSFLL